MKYSKLTIQLTCTGLIILAFVLLNPRSIETRRTSEQLEFDHWLESLEAFSLKNPEQALAISLRLKSAAPELKLNLELASSNNNTIQQQALRLLQLVREANIFSADCHTKSSNDLLNLSISGDLISNSPSGEKPSGKLKYFECALPEAAINKNVAAANMLKLLEVYTQGRQSSSSASGS